MKKLEITCREEGTIDTEPLYAISLGNEFLRVELSNFGATIQQVFMGDKNGVAKNIVAGYTNAADYRDNPHYFGCTVGRYANRIANSCFQLSGTVFHLTPNEGPHHLHGGAEGFNKKLWEVTELIDDESIVGVVFHYRSPDGEEGYPGNLDVRVRFTLNRQSQLGIVYEAITDKATPVNLTNHSYFNLSGFEIENILQHNLQVNATLMTESYGNLPTGNMVELAGTPYDFSSLHQIGQEFLPGIAEGFNVNYVLKKQHSPDLKLAAILHEEVSGRRLKVFTDQPGLQVYMAGFWDGTVKGQHNSYYQQNGGIALETQNFPDSPNQQNFPHSILLPGELYRATTLYDFSLS